MPECSHQGITLYYDGDQNANNGRCSFIRECESNTGLAYFACAFGHLPDGCRRGQYCSTDGGWYGDHSSCGSSCTLQRSCAANSGLLNYACPFEKCFATLPSTAVYQGNDLQQSYLTLSLYACRAACNSDARCFSISYSTAGDGFCYLKDAAHVPTSAVGTADGLSLIHI